MSWVMSALLFIKDASSLSGPYSLEFVIKFDPSCFLLDLQIANNNTGPSSRVSNAASLMPEFLCVYASTALEYCGLGASNVISAINIIKATQTATIVVFFLVVTVVSIGFIRLVLFSAMVCLLFSISTCPYGYQLLFYVSGKTSYSFSLSGLIEP